MANAGPCVAFAMSDGLRGQTFDPADLRRLERFAQITPHAPWTPAGATSPPWARSEVTVLVTGWETPALTEDLLAAMPQLRHVAHAAGSVKALLPQSFWSHDITVSTAAEANAIPVAEYTLAMILLAGKRVPALALRQRRERADLPVLHDVAGLGNYRRTVGLIGFSRIGRRVAELLRMVDLKVVVSDPYADRATVEATGARLVELDELCATSDIVSIHAPDLPETRHLINGERLASMRDGATLINTARGALVDTAALTEAIVSGRIHAVLDVTDPLLLPADSPLWSADNALITPHVAGSLGQELWRMGSLVIDEIERLSQGEAPAYPVMQGDLARMA